MARTPGKAAPAPVAEAPVDEIVIGSTIRFLGYGEDVAAEDQVLTLDAEYEVIGLPTEVDGEMTGFVVRLPNPKFNAKKAANAKTNPEFMDVDVFEEEIELVEALEGEVLPAGGEGEGDEITYEYIESLPLAELIAFAAEEKIKVSAAQKKTAESMVAVIAAHFQLEPAEEGEGNAEGGEGAAEGEGDLPIDLEYLNSLEKEELIALAKDEQVKLTPAQKKTKESIVAALAKEFDLHEPAPEPEPAKPAAKAPTAKEKAAQAKADKAAAAAKPAGKASAKATTKPAAPAKGKATPAPAPEVDPDALPDLENEDQSVLDLIDGDVDLIEVAQNLESETSSNEFRLGGVLYHLKKEGSWKEVDDKYKENGGWNAFVQDHFNVEYRKAQYLIEIYVSMIQAGIPDAAEVVGRIGWTKASKIAKHMLDGENDALKLIEAAETNSVADLSTVLKEDFHIGGTAGEKGEKKTRVTLKFRYTEEEAKIVEDAIHVAGETFGVSGEDALFQILSGWLVENNVETVAAKADEQKAPANTKPAARSTRRATAKA